MPSAIAKPARGFQRAAGVYNLKFLIVLLLPNNSEGRRRQITSKLWEISSSSKESSKSGDISQRQMLSITNTFQGEWKNVENTKMLQKVRDNTEKHYKYWLTPY